MLHKRSIALELSVKIHWRAQTCFMLPTEPLYKLRYFRENFILANRLKDIHVFAMLKVGD